VRICSTSVRQSDVPIEQIGVANCNDQIAARAFGATQHVSSRNFGELSKFDLVMATMWKVKESAFEDRWMNVLHRLKDETNTKVILFQEAETPWPTTRPWDEQKSFIELLGKVDLFLTHNQRDIAMWGPLRKGKPTYRWRTCLDLTAVAPYVMPVPMKTGRAIICGSSYDQRANGLAGLVACRDLGYPLWHQNRSTGYEDRNREVPELLGVKIDKEIPHGNWNQWMFGVHGAYLVVHPMPAASAGRDQICFAAMGIPCVGSMALDIQNELFPMLSVKDVYDVAEIRKLTKRILGDDAMYTYVRGYAMEKVKNYGIPDAQYQAKLIKQSMGWEA
jgi:hypothetical protein